MSLLFTTELYVKGVLRYKSEVVNTMQKCTIGCFVQSGCVVDTYTHIQTYTQIAFPEKSTKEMH